MRAIEILCSTGAFTMAPDYTDYINIGKNGVKINTTAFELLIYRRWGRDLAAIHNYLQSTGLRFPVVHAQKGLGNFLASNATLREGLTHLEFNLQLAASVGAKLLVVHLWDMPSSDKRLSQNIHNLVHYHEMANTFGVEIAVEAVPCAVGDPLTNLQQVLDKYPKCKVTLDTEFLAFHEQLEASYKADWLWPHVAHIHIKDYDGAMVTRGGKRRYLFPRQGNIDFNLLAATLRRVGFTGTISLEASGLNADGTIDYTSINSALCFLRMLVKEA